MCEPIKLKRVRTNIEAVANRNDFGFLNKPTNGIWRKKIQKSQTNKFLIEVNMRFNITKLLQINIVKKQEMNPIGTSGFLLPPERPATGMKTAVIA